MQIINYSLLALLTYIGIFCGALLVFIAPEEQKQGRKYFLLLQKIILAMIIFVLLFNFSIINLLMSVLLSIFIFYMTSNNYMAYLLFAPVFYISLRTSIFTLSISSLIFLYGFATGSLISQPKHRINTLKECLKYSYYPILAITIFILPFLISYF